MVSGPSQAAFNITVFTNGDLTRQQSIRRAAALLSGGRKPQRILKMAKEMVTEDQRKFLDIVDQVCRG